jgi:Flp pilus assembly protein TadG
MYRFVKKNISARGERGAVIVIFAICLFVLIGFAALAIDIGYLHTTRSELQNVADAAALAGARYLGDEYAKLTPSEMGTHPFHEGRSLLQLLMQWRLKTKQRKNLSP